MVRASYSILASLMHRDRSPIGIDIGGEAIKMLQLVRRGGQWQVAASGVHAFGEDVRNNPALRWRYAAGAIESLRASQPFRGNQVVLAMDHEQVLCKNARLPKMPPAELGQAVAFEAAERFPFDPSDGQLRWLLAGEVRQGGELRHEVLMFAASDQALREQLRLLGEANCQPVGLDAQPVALVRGLNFFSPLGRGGDAIARVLLDIGGTHSQVVITRGPDIVFVKTIEIGSADLSRAVTEKVGTSHEDTVALRQRLGSRAIGSGDGEGVGEDSKIFRAVTAAMRPAIERLAHEISLCLRYYSVTFRGNRPGELTLVGGTAHDNLVTAMLAEATGTNVNVGKPLATCQPEWATCQWGAGPEMGGPEWAVALGCCLKPLGNKEKGSVDDSAPVAHSRPGEAPADESGTLPSEDHEPAVAAVEADKS